MAPGVMAGSAAATSLTPDPNAANNDSGAAAFVAPPPFRGVSLRTRRVRRQGGRVALVLACPAGTWQRCSGTLALALRRAPGAARAAFSLAPGAARTVRLPLRASVLAVPARRHVLAGKVGIVARDGAGQSQRRRLA